MKSSFLYAGIVVVALLASCSVQPEPLQYGIDVCHFCKMTLMDKKFGAELVTKKGKVYKFDDLRCLLNYYHSGIEPTDVYQYKLVIDYNSDGKLIDADSAFYISSEEIRSPMDGKVAAFESKGIMDGFKKQWKGIYLTWGEVTAQYK
jgi:copper chaperone NosL